MEQNRIDAIRAVMTVMERVYPDMYKVLAPTIDKVVNPEPEPKQEVAKAHPRMIFEYVRERHEKVGVIVGIRDGNKIQIGWSKANRKLGDVFDKEEGIGIAEARATGMLVSPLLPACMIRQAICFEDRCKRFFKGATSIEVQII